MIGSPERVKIQRSLVQIFSKIKQHLKILGGFLTFGGGLKCPLGVTTTFGVQNNKCADFRQNLKTIGRFLTFLGG